MEYLKIMDEVIPVELIFPKIKISLDYKEFINECRSNFSNTFLADTFLSMYIIDTYHEKCYIINAHNIPHLIIYEDYLIIDLKYDDYILLHKYQYSILDMPIKRIKRLEKLKLLD
jgi:hypothetical protein